MATSVTSNDAANSSTSATLSFRAFTDAIIDPQQYHHIAVIPLNRTSIISSASSAAAAGLVVRVPTPREGASSRANTSYGGSPGLIAPMSVDLVERKRRHAEPEPAAAATADAERHTRRTRARRTSSAESDSADSAVTAPAVSNIDADLALWHSSVSSLQSLLASLDSELDAEFDTCTATLDARVASFGAAEFSRGIMDERRQWSSFASEWNEQQTELRSAVSAAREGLQVLESRIPRAESPPPAAIPSHTEHRPMDLDWFLFHYRDCERRLAARESALKSREERADLRAKLARSDAAKEIQELRDKLASVRNASESDKRKEKREKKAMAEQIEDVRKLVHTKDAEAARARGSEREMRLEVERLQQRVRELDEERRQAGEAVKRERDAEVELARAQHELVTAQSALDHERHYARELQAIIAGQSKQRKERDETEAALRAAVARLESELLEANMEIEMRGGTPRGAVT